MLGPEAFQLIFQVVAQEPEVPVRDPDKLSELFKGKFPGPALKLCVCTYRQQPLRRAIRVGRELVVIEKTTWPRLGSCPGESLPLGMGQIWYGKLGFQAQGTGLFECL